MAIDPRTPVLAGVGIAGSRGSDLDVCDLMAEACRTAADDAGSRRLLEDAEVILVPRGIWPHRDPGRRIAASFGNTKARTTLAELGVLQTTPIEQAASAIARGEVDVAIVVGGEAKWRDLQASLAGTPLPDSAAADGPEADVVLRPHGAIVSAEEIAAGLTSATIQYAMIENARRHADGQSLAEHAAEVANLAARFSAVAAANPDAWNRQPMTADQIAQPSPSNRRQALPYNKWHCSQWNVNQAACLILCSAEVAEARGVSKDRWVFPHAIAWSDHMVPMTNRADLHRSPAFALGGRAALGGRPIEDAAHVDLYSCFPIAVRTQALELGLEAQRPLTVTGGMTFAGGPLNNYVLQSTAKMAGVLRADPGSLGVVTAISGLITKQGLSIWSTTPAPGGYRSIDVSAETAAATPTVAVDAAARGAGRVATYTVTFDRAGNPERGVVLADLPDGRRSLALTTATDILEDMTTEEWCDRTVELDGAGAFNVT